ncbi:MAG: xanthine phosphoribosyltransferase [Lachnospiraceae bacterium]|nr:xanthine phosphoribosyltransferase [Lachnospiraceae bacterium]
MEALKQKIKAEGKMLGEDIVKVDSFINHQVDVELMEAIGKDIAEQFAGKGVTKIFTIESSGIAPSVFAAKYMNLPLVILKKQSSRTLSQNLWQTEVISYTKGITYELTLSKDYISDQDHILIIDDFLANGEAATGAVRLIRKAHATVAGLAVLIEKAYQPGRGKLEAQGIPVYAQARIAKCSAAGIEFEED